MHSILEDALRFARTGRGGLGVPVFWAVANADVAVALDEVNASGLTIPVGATDHRDVRAACAHGPELAFMAPGVRVVSTLPGELTATVTGTSFAAPTAAGVAALVLSVHPGLSADEVTSLLKATCDRLPAQDGVQDHRHGAGRLNAAQAVDAALAARAARAATVEPAGVSSPC
jgi:thermitase